MIWNICFTVSLTVFLIAALFAGNAMRRFRDRKFLSPFYTLFTGAFLAVFTGLIPVFAGMMSGEPFFVLKLCTFDILQTIQVFTVNVGADFILENINSATASISGIYSAYMTVLFLIAPVLTFGFLISLFKSVSAYLDFRFHFWGDIYAFSVLNEKSLTLAKSIKKHDRKAFIVFTCVDSEEGGKAGEYTENARKLNAILFRDDIITVDFMKHSKKTDLKLFAIGEKEGDNLIQALKLLEKYRQRKHTDLYVFSAGEEGELLLANVFRGEVKLRRVNEIRSLVYNFLYDEGHRLFETAVGTEQGKKEVHVVIAGLGQYGREMLKALSWFLQMDGYSFTIHAFDRDERAEDRFAALCPELLSEKYNGCDNPDGGKYEIQIHPGVEVETRTFAKAFERLPEATFVFVSLGDDAANISQAARIRMLCERAGSKPVIKTIIYNEDEKEALTGVVNYRGQAYGIEAVGNMSSFYSEKNLMGSELEKLALERHLKWGQENEFWQYEYNYRSSMAAAIHLKARLLCGINGSDREEARLTAQERKRIEQLEHRRWNAYMRSEGYIYSGSPDKTSRNDLAKMHHDLTDFGLLSEEDQRKDSRIGTL